MLNEVLIGMGGFVIVMIMLSLMFIFLNGRFINVEEAPVNNLILISLILFLIVIVIDLLKFLLVRYEILNQYITWINHEYISYLMVLGVLPLLFIFYVVITLYVRETQNR